MLPIPCAMYTPTIPIFEIFELSWAFRTERYQQARTFKRTTSNNNKRRKKKTIAQQIIKRAQGQLIKQKIQKEPPIHHESPFMKSVINYYQARPVELEHITIADFAANYNMEEHRGTSQHI